MQINLLFYFCAVDSIGLVTTYLAVYRFVLERIFMLHSLVGCLNHCLYNTHGFMNFSPAQENESPPLLVQTGYLPPVW